MLLANKGLNKILIAYLIVVLITNFFSFRTVSAASLYNVSDLVSDSRLNTAADHKVEFTTTIDIGDNGYFEITLPADFGDIDSASCSGPSVTISTTTETVRCTYSTSPGAATSTVITIEGVTNPPAAGSQFIDIATYNSSSVIRESGTAAVYINDGCGVSLDITTNLGFTLASTTDISEVNGIPLTGSSTANTLPFGELIPNSSSTLAHTLAISTNAEHGFSCTVEQSQNFENDNGNTINSFDNAPDGTGSSTLPHAWNPPSAIYSGSETFGHWGVTTDDDSLSSLDFSGSKFAGLNSTDPLEIFYNPGPAGGTVLGIGIAHIAYSVEISYLQEAGNYQNTLTYICTATY